MSTLVRLALEFTKDLFVDVEEVRLRAAVVVDRYATWVAVAAAMGATIGFQVGKHVEQLSRLAARLAR
jgi:hypothetical protein